jgi:hypothetical protein
VKSRIGFRQHLRPIPAPEIELVLLLLIHFCELQRAAPDENFLPAFNLIHPAWAEASSTFANNELGRIVRENVEAVDSTFDNHDISLRRLDIDLKPDAVRPYNFNDCAAFNHTDEQVIQRGAGHLKLRITCNAQVRARIKQHFDAPACPCRHMIARQQIVIRCQFQLIAHALALHHDAAGKMVNPTGFSGDNVLLSVVLSLRHDRSAQDDS